MHEGDTCGVPSKYWNGVLPSSRTVNLERTNPALRIANGMACEIAESCMPVFVSILCLVASCESLYVFVHSFDKPVALMACFWRKS